jgi:hypothetical protein
MSDSEGDVQAAREAMQKLSLSDREIIIDEFSGNSNRAVPAYGGPGFDDYDAPGDGDDDIEVYYDVVVTSYSDKKVFVLMLRETFQDRNQPISELFNIASNLPYTIHKNVGSYRAMALQKELNALGIMTNLISNEY